MAIFIFFCTRFGRWCGECEGFPLLNHWQEALRLSGWAYGNMKTRGMSLNERCMYTSHWGFIVFLLMHEGLIGWEMKGRGLQWRGGNLEPRHMGSNYGENILAMSESFRDASWCSDDSTSVRQLGPDFDVSCSVGEVWFTSDAHEHGGTYILLNIKEPPYHILLIDVITVCWQRLCSVLNVVCTLKCEHHHCHVFTRTMNAPIDRRDMTSREWRLPVWTFALATL